MECDGIVAVCEHLPEAFIRDVLDLPSNNCGGDTVTDVDQHPEITSRKIVVSAEIERKSTVAKKPSKKTKSCQSGV